VLINSVPYKLFYAHKPYMHITCCAIIINIPSAVELFPSSPGDISNNTRQLLTSRYLLNLGQHKFWNAVSLRKVNNTHNCKVKHVLFFHNKN